MLQFADDFKGYGTNINLLLNGLYAEIGNATSLDEDPDPNVTGTVLRSAVNPVDGCRIRRVFRSSQTVAGMAFRLWLSSLPVDPDGTPAFCFCNAGNGREIAVTINTTGSLSIRDGSGTGSVQATTAGPVVVANAWNHLEIKAVASAISGSVEIRVNGVSKLTSPAFDTGLEYSQWAIDNAADVAQSYDFYVKDLVVWDGSGASNNNFQGMVSVIGRVTSADVTLGGWVPSIGTTGFNLLDNSPPLDATEYISAADPPPLPCSFQLAQLPEDVTSVRGLITQVRARNIDGGDGSIQASLTSGASTANGVDRPITTAFTYYEDVFEVDPATSTNWTPASADAAILNIDRTV